MNESAAIFGARNSQRATIAAAPAARLQTAHLQAPLVPGRGQLQPGPLPAAARPRLCPSRVHRCTADRFSRPFLGSSMDLRWTFI